MTLRRFILTSVSFAFLTAASPMTVRADDPPASGDVETAKHNFIGEINANSVFVRSAPREDAYPTMKLDKPARVTVVGIKYKFLKILPPEGSFAYVPKAYINKRGNGGATGVGRASREIIAKAGSAMNQQKTSPMGKIDEGQDVEILGEQDEWYKIKPPQGSFCYISQSYVSPVQALPTVAEQKAHTPVAKVDTGTGAAKVDTGVPANVDTPVEPVVSQTPGSGSTAATPATAPAAVVDSFEILEGKFKAASELVIGDQPVDELLAAYRELLKQGGLDSRAQQIAGIRVKTLELRTKSKAEYLALKQEQVLAADQQKARVAEREEIQQRIKEKQVTFYAAVGTLRASSVQRGGGTLVRVTDPATGRTLAYARVTDSKYGNLLGQFVGVKGTISTDGGLSMKIIEQPTVIESIDPAKVNDSIAAQIVPPSLTPGQVLAHPAGE